MEIKVDDKLLKEEIIKGYERLAFDFYEWKHCNQTKQDRKKLTDRWDEEIDEKIYTALSIKRDTYLLCQAMYETEKYTTSLGNTIKYWWDGTLYSIKIIIDGKDILEKNDHLCHYEKK